MNSIGLCVCDICGTRSADHAGWYVVAGTGSRLEVLPWSDELLARSDCRHACSGEHVEKLVFASATHELGAPLLTLPPKRGGWNPSSLVPPTPETPGDDPLGEVMDAIDSILGRHDEESRRTFDA